MDGKEKCEFLRTFRKKIAEDNGIVLEQKDCTHEGDCLGTCPMCDAEAAFLLDELKKKEVIHIKADGKLSMENADINIDNFIRLTEQLNDMPVKDEEPLEYMGDITPSVIMPGDLPSPPEPGEDGNGSDDKDPFDGWD